MKNKTNTPKTSYLILNTDEYTHTEVNTIEEVEQELEVLAQEYDGRLNDFKKYAEQYLEVYEIVRTLKINVPTKSVTVE